MQQKKAIIIGAGPAGLTAAYELLKRTDIKPIIIEQSAYIGGLACTINYKGNRIDIGGHRFFSKSDRVMKWWLNIMPLASNGAEPVTISYQNKQAVVDRSAHKAENDGNNIMLIRKRRSRIYFLRKFFSYPVKLNMDTLRKLGAVRTMKIMVSYMRSKAMPIKEEQNLEQFFINRFGRELYKTFFKSYTEKVWGIDCKQISAEWGAQRIKSISITDVIRHALKPRNGSIAQKDVPTSFIEQFLYPKLGPGQLWEEVARQVKKMGGEILMECTVEGLIHNGERITQLIAKNTSTGEIHELSGDYFFSTMPVKELIGGMTPAPPEIVRGVANGLVYRDFITVGLLLNELVVKDEHTANKLIQDTWIYIHEHDCKIGRLQVFNNWSPYMVRDTDKVWLGLEFFCNRTDELWQMKDGDFIRFAIAELEHIGIIRAADVVDSTMIRDLNTYPAYFGSYNRFEVIREYVNGFDNLFLIGRNGMHRYNNSDHSMLTAMTAVDNIIAGITNKENIWSINTEQEYTEA